MENWKLGNELQSRGTAVINNDCYMFKMTALVESIKGDSSRIERMRKVILSNCTAEIIYLINYSQTRKLSAIRAQI